MGKASLRNLLAHKGRLALSLLAVILSTGFVAGTLIFTDTLDKTFDDLFAQTTSDVLVSPRNAGGPSGEDAGGAVPVVTVPAATVQKVAQAPGIAAAVGDVFVPGATIVGADGKAVGAGGAPSYGVNWEGDQRLSPLRLVDGRGPTAPGEMAIDTQSASKGRLHVGDRTTVITPAGIEPVTIVGVFRFGTSGNLAGATLAAFATETAQDYLMAGSRDFTSVSAAAATGISQDQAAANVRAAVGPGYRVQTGAEAADESATEIRQALSFFNTFLLVFAMVSVFVGLFLIANTFAMIVAQRTRELALFRAIGASRGQVRRGVLLEAVVVGLLGAALGVLAGVGLALLLRALFVAIGVDFPAGSLVIAPRTAVVALVVGVGATLVASWLPARRAARLSPMAALREDMMPATRALRVRSLAGVALLVVAAVLLVMSFAAQRTSTAASLVGGSFLVALVGVIVIAPALAGPVVRVLGWPFRGTIGRIAVGNALRNRRRTALTATALTVGLALVGAFATMAVSTADSADASIDKAVRADFIVSTKTFQPMPAEVGDAVAATPGIGVVSRIRITPAAAFGTDVAVVGVDPSTINEVLSLTLAAGSADLSGPSSMLIDTTMADRHGLSVGDTIAMTFASGRQRTFTVVGIYDASGGFSGPVTTLDALTAAGVPPLDQFIYATVAAGADPQATHEAVDAAVADNPTVQVQDMTEFKASIRGQVNQLLAVIYVLLALSLLVAVLGIVNTLALSVVERTREVGLLRAVGTSRRQLRRMIRIESLVTSVFGAVTGLALGIFFGQMLVRALRDQGLAVVATPWTSLVVFLVLAALVGVLAAAWPAWRASRMDILQAIATE